MKHISIARWASIVFALAGIATFFLPCVEIMEEIGTGFQIANFDKPGEWTHYSLAWLSPAAFALILLAGALRLARLQLILSVATTIGPLIALQWAKKSFPEHWKYVILQYGTWMLITFGALCTLCAIIQCVRRRMTMLPNGQK